MTVYLTKRPEADREVSLAWDELHPGEAVAEDLGWLIIPQELDAAALRLTACWTDAVRSVARVAGGRAGHLYHVSARVRTSAGRVLSRATLLRVAAA